MKVLRIPVEQIPQRWSTIAPFIDDALTKAGADLTVEQAKVYLSLNQWMLLGVFDGAELKGVTTIQYSNKANDRVAYITSIGGRNIVNPDTYEQFNAILKANGATKVQGGVRESVARLWRRLGFRQVNILVEKKL